MDMNLVGQVIVCGEKIEMIMMVIVARVLILIVIMKLNGWKMVLPVANVAVSFNHSHTLCFIAYDSGYES